jgi:hypothetical protein
MGKLADKYFGPIVIVCAPLFLLIALVGPQIGFPHPDTVHSFAVHIRGHGTLYFHPVIGFFFYLVHVAGCLGLAGLALNAVLRLFSNE